MHVVFVFINSTTKECNGVIIISFNKLTHNDEFKNVFENFEKYLLSDDGLSSLDNFRILKDDNIRGNLSFALGAGCSVDSNISDWNTLSEALSYELIYKSFVSTPSEFKKNILSKNLNDKLLLSFDKTSALDAAFIYFTKITGGSEYDFYMSLHDSLYMYYLINYAKDNILLTSINQRILRNNIKEIVSYNFDSALEQNFDPSNYTSTSVEISSSETHLGNCTVKHVHGYIPFDYDGTTLVNNFVFTDTDYYENSLLKNNYCNQTQSNLFDSKNIIFVGVSFTDSNLKDILRKRIMKRTSSKTNLFAFMKIPSFKGNKTLVNELERKYMLLQQSYFDRFDVKILRVKKFSEIPEK